MENSEKRTNRPRARQSIAHMPSSRLNGIDKQNATIDISAARKAQEINSQLLKKRTRGKSLGPGGLEALAETDGNIIKVCAEVDENCKRGLISIDRSRLTTQVDSQADSTANTAKKHTDFR